jgi:hypothetical protein
MQVVHEELKDINNETEKLKENSLENDGLLKKKPNSLYLKEESNSALFLKIAIPIGITLMTSAAIGYAIYQTSKNYVEHLKAEQISLCYSVGAAVLAACLLAVLFSNYNKIITHEKSL